MRLCERRAAQLATARPSVEQADQVGGPSPAPAPPALDDQNCALTDTGLHLRLASDQLPENVHSSSATPAGLRCYEGIGHPAH